MNLSEKQKIIIDRTIDFVKTTLREAEGGHDWWHIYRVWRIAIQIGIEENANQFIIQLGALTHDIADSKFTGGKEDIGPKLATDFLKSQGVEQRIINDVVSIIRKISFKNSINREVSLTKEEQVVQDADRLDAIGAIGIARAFNYGGYKNSIIYDPHQKPKKYNSKDDYTNTNSTTINHFYEKLFLLKDKMNTKTGKKLAEGRHRYMESYMKQFFMEWEGTL
jgi:uncharacterized protein